MVAFIIGVGAAFHEKMSTQRFKERANYFVRHWEYTKRELTVEGVSFLEHGIVSKLAVFLAETISARKIDPTQMRRITTFRDI
jgi:hypothetical protein